LKPLRSAPAGQSSGTGINGDVSHFAIPREQCQQVDEAILPMAEPRSDHFALVSRDCALGGRQRHDLAAVLGLLALLPIQAGRGFRRQSCPLRQTTQREGDQDDDSESGHGWLAASSDSGSIT